MKNKKFTRILSFMLVLLLGFQSAGMVAYGAEQDFEIQMANEIEAPSGSTALLEDGESGMPEDVVLSYRDIPGIDTSFAEEDEATINALQGTLPVSYSSASNIPSSIVVSQKGDYVTTVKDQNPYGTCWAFSAINAAESGYHKENGLSASTSGIDWNEYHLVYYFWNTPDDPLGLTGGDFVYNNSDDSDLMVGGNSAFTLYAYANWIGASDDTSFGASDVLNDTGYGDTEFAYDAAAHMENGYILTMPDMTSSNYQADMNLVKQMIMDYGSVDIAYYAYHNSPYWNGNAYQYINQSTGTNHAVSIVGWNDSIPATAFGITAPGNGAWLVKNSWGSSWGQGGYFWLSYYDGSIASNAYAYDFTDADTYDNNYQYDGGVAPMYGYTNDHTITGANAFVADSNETIEAVGFYTLNVNTNYTISIYTGLGATSLPQEGKLAYTQSGTEMYAGFHTVDLNTPVSVAAGERYAVVVTIEKYGYEVYMSIDLPLDNSWLLTYSFAEEGESYIGGSAASLEEINEGNEAGDLGYNIRIKSFTNERAKDKYDDVPYGVKQGPDGNWYFYKDGAIDYTYNGLAKTELDYIFFIRDGKVDFSVNGLAACGNGWYYFVNGNLQRINTLVLFNGVWFSVQDGEIAWNYTGLQEYQGVWFYIQNGSVNWNYRGLVEWNGVWFFVEGGSVNWTYRGMVDHAGIWFFVENGSVNWTYNSLVEWNGVWFYVANGTIQWNCDTLVEYQGVWFYATGGSVNWTYEGWVQYQGVWFYVKNGSVDWSRM